MDQSKVPNSSSCSYSLVSGRSFFSQWLNLGKAALVLALGKAVALWAIARNLGPEAQGSFSLAVSILSITVVAGSIGLEYANAHLAGRRSETIGILAKNTLIWTITVSALATPFWLIGVPFVFPNLVAEAANEKVIFGLLLACSLGAMLLAINLRATFVGSMQYGVVAKADLCWGVIWGIAGSVAAMANLFAVLVAWTITVTMVTVYYLCNHHWLINRHASWNVFGAQIRYGLKILPGNLARAVNVRFPLFLVAVAGNSTELGVLGVILAAGELFLYLPNVLSQVTLGNAASARHDKQTQQLSYALVCGLGGGGVIVSVLAGEWILATVFGPAYEMGAGALPLVLLSSVCHSVGIIRAHELLGIGRPLAVTLGQFMILANNLLLGYFLVLNWGLLGAGITMLIGYAAYMFVLLSVKDA